MTEDVIVLFSFQADRPGFFEVREGSRVLERVVWNAGDVVLVLSDGTRMVLR